MDRFAQCHCPIKLKPRPSLDLYRRSPKINFGGPTKSALLDILLTITTLKGRAVLLMLDRFAPSDCRDRQPLQSHPEHPSVSSDDEMGQSVQTPPDRN
jgi:hypothetical protein